MNAYLKLYAKPFYSKDFCSRHKFQIDPLHASPLKVCDNCGQTEPLSGNEIYWPANPTEKFSSLEGRISKLNKRAYLALLLTALVLLKLNYSEISNSFTGLFAIVTQAVTTVFYSPPNLENDTRTVVAKANISAPPNKPQQVKTPASFSGGVAKFSADARPNNESTAVNQEEQNIISARQASVQIIDQPDGDEIYREHADSAPVAGGIETKITKAINNRAVFGVTVSFEKNTAFLAGLVKTENQKSAAEQAALSVPEVERIKSSIQVEWLGG